MCSLCGQRRLKRWPHTSQKAQSLSFDRTCCSSLRLFRREFISRYPSPPMAIARSTRTTMISELINLLNFPFNTAVDRAMQTGPLRRIDRPGNALFVERKS
jgi:hypothetical protein